jgi:hypothetical protein
MAKEVRIMLTEFVLRINLILNESQELVTTTNILEGKLRLARTRLPKS